MTLKSNAEELALLAQKIGAEVGRGRTSQSMATWLLNWMRRSLRF